MRCFRVLCLALILLPAIVVAQSSGFAIQVGALPSQTEAESFAAELKRQGLKAYWIKSDVTGRGILFRVRIGQYGSRELAQNVAARLRQEGKLREYFIAEYIAPQSVAASNSETRSATIAPASASQASAPASIRAATDSASVMTELSTQSASLSVSPTIVDSVPAVSSAPENTPAANLAASKNVAPNSLTVAPLPSGYRRYEDADAGYSFACPNDWKGGRWLRQERAGTQTLMRMDAAANFNSETDLAFVNAIWNVQADANSDRYNNDQVVETILSSMRATPGVRGMTELSRRVVTAGDQIQTQLELRMKLGPAESPNPIEFDGRAILVRSKKGILLVAAFFSQAGSAAGQGIAEQIVQSVRLTP